SEVDFIVSLNLRRRHLTDDQRAAIAAELANLRQGDNRFTVDTPTGGSIRQAAAAKAMKVPVRRVQRAAVVKKASPKLHEEVKAGKVKLATAVAKVKPKTNQKASASKNKIMSAPPVAVSASPALSGTENTTTTANMRNIVERFVTAVEDIETWAEEIEGRLDEVAAADRR